jgi:hypothetical protein
MLMPGTLPGKFFKLWTASKMRRLNRKVIGPPSLLQDTCSFADVLIFVLVALTARLEAAEKALSEETVAQLAANQPLAEEKAAQQIIDQALRSSQETTAALT